MELTQRPVRINITCRLIQDHKINVIIALFNVETAQVQLNVPLVSKGIIWSLVAVRHAMGTLSQMDIPAKPVLTERIPVVMFAKRAW